MDSKKELNISGYNEQRVLILDSYELYEVEGSSTRSSKFRKAMRCLSNFRNMPYCTYSNTSGGVHCGFYFHSDYEFDKMRIATRKQGELIFEGEDIQPYILDFIDYIEEHDPMHKYSIYQFI